MKTGLLFTCSDLLNAYTIEDTKLHAAAFDKEV